MMVIGSGKVFEEEHVVVRVDTAGQLPTNQVR